MPNITYNNELHYFEVCAATYQAWANSTDAELSGNARIEELIDWLDNYGTTEEVNDARDILNNGEITRKKATIKGDKMSTKKIPQIQFDDKGQMILNFGKVSTKIQRRIAFFKKTAGMNNRRILDYLELTANKERYDWLSLQKKDFNNPKRDILSVKPKNTTMVKFKELFDVSKNKGPNFIPIGKAVGVEIEFCIPYGMTTDADGVRVNTIFKQYCVDRQITAGKHESARQMFTDMCFERKIKGINIGTDGSIRPMDYFAGLEARIICNADDLSNLEKFCKLLKDLGCMVNKSCGLHIHLDFRDYERLPTVPARRLYNALPILKAMMPASRQDNTYCQHDLASKSGDNRYACINDTAAFEKFKTIEVRMHSGSINFNKIGTWIKLLRSIAYSTKRGLVTSDELTGTKTISIDAYASKLEWPIELTQYVINRIQKHNPTNTLLTGHTAVVTINDVEVEQSEVA